MSPASEVKEGESVTVSCLSDGAPVGRMVLRRLSEDQDVELQSSNGSSTSFTLSSALLADSALYQCQAFNEHGSQKVSALLSVEGEIFFYIWVILHFKLILCFCAVVTITTLVTRFELCNCSFVH